MFSKGARLRKAFAFSFLVAATAASYTEHYSVDAKGTLKLEGIPERLKWELRVFGPKEYVTKASLVIPRENQEHLIPTDLEKLGIDLEFLRVHRCLNDVNENGDPGYHGVTSGG